MGPRCMTCSPIRTCQGPLLQSHPTQYFVSGSVARSCFKIHQDLSLIRAVWERENNDACVSEGRLNVVVECLSRRRAGRNETGKQRAATLTTPLPMHGCPFCAWDGSAPWVCLPPRAINSPPQRAFNQDLPATPLQLPVASSVNHIATQLSVPAFLFQHKPRNNPCLTCPNHQLISRLLATQTKRQ